MAQVYGQRWKVLRSIGEGGQAYVFLVQDARGQYPESVLKRIRNPKRRDRFLREVNALRSLKHKNIIPIIESSAADSEDLYIVMPYLRGGDLSARVRHYKGSLDTTLRLGSCLANALAYAHHNKIVHRDLKPENVLFGEDDLEPILTDFGICWQPSEVKLTQDGEVVGPRAFLAPELESGSDSTSPACDVYSLGKLIYYIFSGGVILPRERHREDGFELFSGRGHRHERLGLLLDRMLCHLSNRIGMMSDVARELERIASWERNMKGLETSNLRGAIGRALSGETKLQAARESEKLARSKRNADFKTVTSSVKSWLLEELTELATKYSAAGVLELKAEEREPKDQAIQVALHRYFLPIAEIQFRATLPSRAFGEERSIVFVIAREAANFGGFDPDSEDLLVTCIYERDEHHREFVMTQSYAFSQGHVGLTYSKYLGGHCNLDYEFKLGAWPGCIDRLSAIVAEGVETLFILVKEKN